MSASQPPVISPNPPTTIETAPPAPLPPVNRQAELEYERLTATFERLVKITGTCIAAIVTVGGIFFYANVSDARKDAIESANQEARKAVAAALETPNLQRIIEAEVRARTKASVEAQIQETLGGKIDEFQKEQKQVSAAVIHAALSQSMAGYGGGGSTEHLRQLDNQMYDSPYSSVRALARDSIHQLALDYERESGSFNPALYKPNARGYLSNQPDGRATLALLNKSDTSMFELYKAFVDLKKLTGWNVEPFDIRGANEWCGKHDCKLSTPTR